MITLVIIGVITAMTVPSLMNNTNAQEYRSAFKKSISSLNQALTLNYALEGLSAQDYTSAELVTDMFKSRMNIMTSDNNQQNKSPIFTELIPKAYAADFVPEVEEITPTPEIVTPDEGGVSDDGGETVVPDSTDSGDDTTGTFTNTDVCAGSNVWTTTDGIIFCISSNYSSDNDDSQTSTCNSYNTVPCSSNGEANIFIDVNGAKKPNQLTTSSNRPRDIYQAMIYAQKVIPYGDAAQQVMFDKNVSS